MIKKGLKPWPKQKCIKWLKKPDWIMDFQSEVKNHCHIYITVKCFSSHIPAC